MLGQYQCHLMYSVPSIIGAISVRQLAHVFGALEITEGPASARMHHA